MSGGRQKVDLDSLSYYYCPLLRYEYRQAVEEGREPVLSYHNKGHLALIERPAVRDLIAVGIGRIVDGRRKPWVNYFAKNNSCLGGVGLFLKWEGEFQNDTDGGLRTVIGVYVKIKKTAHNGNSNGNSNVKAKQDKFGNYVISIGDFLHQS